ncbi:MAG: antibiotic biosynthesis monooxygenase [Ferruginibacter sp.]|nr:antibiotic biosynthesis monooxygenase [Cytophagales bacterium]
MITRIWHGRTRSESADEYLSYVLATGAKDYRQTKGNLDVQILKRDEGEITHFWTLSKWDSIESIKLFAGEDHERARYYPADGDFLLEFEPNVIHCETFEPNKIEYQ